MISGPAGVGKSTTSRELVHSLERSAYISGDDISHIPVKGREKPWLSEETLKLTWKNIASITKNLIDSDFDVVIDYVAFPKDLDYLISELKEYDVRIVYVVLMVELKTLIDRDRQRPVEIQMGQRCAVLHKEFEEAFIDKKHILETDHYTTNDLTEIVNDIKNDKRFVVKESFSCR